MRLANLQGTGLLWSADVAPAEWRQRRSGGRWPIAAASRLDGVAWCVIGVPSIGAWTPMGSPRHDARPAVERCDRLPPPSGWYCLPSGAAGIRIPCVTNRIMADGFTRSAASSPWCTAAAKVAEDGSPDLPAAEHALSGKLSLGRWLTSSILGTCPLHGVPTSVSLQPCKLSASNELQLRRLPPGFRLGTPHACTSRLLLSRLNPCRAPQPPLHTQRFAPSLNRLWKPTEWSEAAATTAGRAGGAAGAAAGRAGGGAAAVAALHAAPAGAAAAAAAAAPLSTAATVMGAEAKMLDRRRSLLPPHSRLHSRQRRPRQTPGQHPPLSWWPLPATT